MSGLKDGALVRATVKNPSLMNKSGKVLLNVTAVEALETGHRGFGRVGVRVASV